MTIITSQLLSEEYNKTNLSKICKHNGLKSSAKSKIHLIRRIIEQIEKGINIEIPDECNKKSKSGGSNTNKNGLKFEDDTKLDDKFQIYKDHSDKLEGIFNSSNKHWFQIKKNQFQLAMKSYRDDSVNNGHGCKQPDESYMSISEKEKRLFLIEKKYQECSGSVCEKIQTPDFKLWQYKRLYPDFDIVYIYCLSDWFKENCKAEIEYLQHKQIPYFWGSSVTYKEDIINFIINYK